MCLALPARVVSVNGGKAVVEQLGSRRAVFNNVINAGVGEFVLVQQGFIVERIPERDALDALEAVGK